MSQTLVKPSVLLASLTFHTSTTKPVLTSLLPLRSSAAMQKFRPHVACQGNAYSIATPWCCLVWKPSTRISSWKAMYEAIHLPWLPPVSVGLQYRIEPLVVATHGFGQQESLLDAIDILWLPEHFEDLLLFGTVNLKMRIAKNGMAPDWRELPEITAKR